METVTFSELRNHAKKYFDAVEQGATFEVYRNGKPIASLTPYRPAPDRWKSAKPLKLSGVSLSAAILAERRKGR